jgi:hypothetical protein
VVDVLSQVENINKLQTVQQNSQTQTMISLIREGVYVSGDDEVEEIYRYNERDENRD